MAELSQHRADLPRYVHAIANSLAPADPAWLSNRLSGMQLAMTQGWSEAKATAWLHETQRLLREIPSDILGWALDEAVKASTRGFVPSVGEIRAFADPKLQERRKIAARLNTVAHMASMPVREAEKTEFDESERVTPEQMEAIKAEFGLKTSPYPEVRTPRGPQRKPTRDDYIALGVDPSILDRLPGMAA